MTTDACPICGGSGCNIYPLMTERFLAGINVDHWRRIHDDMNGIRNQSSPSLVPVKESLAILNQIKACPHRSRDSGCGCSGMRCGLGKGRHGIVSFNDCSACIKEGMPINAQ